MSREIRNSSTCKLHYDRSAITARPAHKQTRQSYAWQNHQRSIFKIYSTSPHSQPLQHHCWGTPEIYTFNRDKAAERGLYSTISTTHNEDFPRKLHDSLKPLILFPRLYIHIQKVLIINTCHIVRFFFFGRMMNNKCFVSEPYSLENS
jgi:hypothetical protein